MLHHSKTHHLCRACGGRWWEGRQKSLFCFRKSNLSPQDRSYWRPLSTTGRKNKGSFHLERKKKNQLGLKTSSVEVESSRKWTWSCLCPPPPSPFTHLCPSEDTAHSGVPRLCQRCSSTSPGSGRWAVHARSPLTQMLSGSTGPAQPEPPNLREQTTWFHFVQQDPTVG